MPTRKLACLAAVLFSTSFASGSGVPITIEDPSFEDASFGSNPWTNTITPWEETDGPGSTGAFKERISGFSADGLNHLGLVNGHLVWQDLEAAYHPGTRYTLTVAVGHRPGFNSSDGEALFRLATPGGSILAEGSFNASTIDDNEFIDQSITFETPSAPEVHGETIRIVLTGAGPQRSHFDHIRLQAQALLPPEIPELGPLSAEAFSSSAIAVMGEVVFDGHETPEVVVVYGQSDGGTERSAWESEHSLGPRSGVFSAFIEGLQAETPYYYRAWAENSAGIAWAPESGTITTAAPQPARAVINEFHYKPYDKNVLEEFIELYNPGDEDLDLSGWQIDEAIRYTFPPDSILPAGGYVVVGEDPPTLLDVYGVEAFGPWSGSLSSDGESIQLLDADGVIHNRVDYGAGFPWPTLADGEGSSVELLHPDLDNSHPASWRASGFPVSGGGAIGPPTPGSVNSVHLSFGSAPPAIDRVAHNPVAPRSDQTVLISARILSHTPIEAVTLTYQLVDPGSYIRITDTGYETDWTELPMHADETAGPGIYVAELPSELQEHRRLVRYRITAEDAAGNRQTVPYPDDEQPNFAYYVYDAIPDWQGAFEPGNTPLLTYPEDFLETLPVYTLIADDQDVVNSQYNGSYDSHRFRGTFVYDGVVYDHIEFRNRGQASTYVAGKNKWRIHFNTSRRGVFRKIDGDPYQEDWGILTINAAASPWAALNRGIAGVDEMLPYELYRLSGVLSPHTHYFHFRVVRNAEEAPTPGADHSDRLGTADGQYLSDFWGLYYAIEPIRGPFIRERDLPKGSIYQIEGGGTDKEYQGVGQPSDLSDWHALRNTVTSSPAREWWETHFDLESFYTFHALNRLLGNVDLRAEHNYHLYHRPDGRWFVIPWDLDMMFIAKSHWTASIGGTSYPGVTMFHRLLLDHPEFVLQYRNRAREILDLVAEDGSRDGGQIGTLISYFADIVAPGGTDINWANADAAQWNLHPRTRGTLGNASGQTNHLGNFFRSPFTDNRFDGNWIRWLRSPNFEGHGNHADFMDYIRDYVTDTWPGGAWTISNGDQRGYGYQYLASEAADPAIPDRPVITYTGGTDFPANDLHFSVSAFADPQGAEAYAGTAWRIAQVGRSDPTEPPAYEIQAVWESGTLTANTPMALPLDTVRPGRTYRARVRHLNDTGRWSHWSEPVEFTAGAPLPETLIHYWNFNDTVDLLEPTHTLTGGSLNALPGAVTEFTHATGQDFSAENARFGDPAGSHFRVNDPLGAVLTFQLPTDGFENPVLRFETRRSGQGAGTQVLTYTLDGAQFQELTRYPVFNDPPVRKTFDFSSVAGAADNPDFAIRITFLRDEGGTSGNNRFDNVTLDGLPLEGTLPPPIVNGPVPTVFLISGGEAAEIDLETVFTVHANEPPTYTLENAYPQAADATIEGAKLPLAGLAAGEAAVTVSVDDAHNPPVATVIRVLIYPPAHPLSQSTFRFHSWNPETPERVYPGNMIFLQSEINDPGPHTPLDRAYYIPEDDYASGDTINFPYNNQSRTRINGLGEDGMSFINTGRGRDVGAALAAVDTRNINGARLGFIAGTVTPNSRVYALTLQYRAGAEGPFEDFLTQAGQPVTYLRSETAGDTVTFGPIDLPAHLLGHEHLQLSWRYHHVDGDNGPRAELRLDDIVIAAEPGPEDGFEAWRRNTFPDWSDFANDRISGPRTTARGDGVSHLFRYALGLELEESAMGRLPYVDHSSSGARRFLFPFDPEKPDLAWRVQRSTDLIDWSETFFDSSTDPVPDFENGWAVIALPENDDGNGESLRQFLRLSLRLR